MKLFKKEKKYTLVFAGGGVKGAYQVGVAKALKELKIPIQAVTGTSIGALNGALFIQGDILLMEQLYHTIEIQDIMKLSENNQLKGDADLFSFHNLLTLASEYIKNDGISNEPLQKLIHQYIDVDKIYRSKIDFGITVYDKEQNKGIELWKEQIEKERLCDYLLASSCFPIFKPQVIQEKEYLDGGLFDNMPVNMLIKKGYRNIILVDIMGIGMIKKTQQKDVNIKVISPQENLGGTFEFNQEKIKTNIKRGYYDTLKVFHKVVGNQYYFTPSEFNKLLKRFTLDEIMGLEYAADIYHLNPFQLYRCDEFLDKIDACYQKEALQYQKVRTTLTLTNIHTYIKNETGISVAMDLISNYPSLYHETMIRKIIGKYIKAAHAIQVMKNSQK